MQYFVFLAAFFLVEKKGARKEERRREKKDKNAKYYGHYVALAHALRSDQNQILVKLVFLACLKQMNITCEELNWTSLVSVRQICFSF